MQRIKSRGHTPGVRWDGVQEGEREAQYLEALGGNLLVNRRGQ